MYKVQCFQQVANLHGFTSTMYRTSLKQILCLLLRSLLSAGSNLTGILHLFDSGATLPPNDPSVDKYINPEHAST